MTRGEIWWPDFGIPFGSEPGFKDLSWSFNNQDRPKASYRENIQN